MKKTFLSKRNSLLSSTSFSWGAVALCIAFVALLIRFVAPNMFWFTTSPVFWVADSFASANHAFVSSFGDAQALALQNDELKRDNLALASENSALVQKMSVLSALSASADKSLQEPMIVAGVLVRPPSSPYDTLVLAGGTIHGIEQGMEAFAIPTAQSALGGVPIGIVEKVSTNYARLLLFSAPGVNTLGWVGKSSAPISIEGAGGGAMYASVARAANIMIGDTVFVPGPGMLPVGTVSRIDSDPSSPSVILRIAPSVNIFSTTWVALRGAGEAAFSSFLSATSSRP